MGKPFLARRGVLARGDSRRSFPFSAKVRREYRNLTIQAVNGGFACGIRGGERTIHGGETGIHG